MKHQHTQLLTAVLLVGLAAGMRIVNAGIGLHNFVPIAVIGLFSGAILRQNRPLAILIPLLGQFLADVYFQLFTATPGFYSLVSQLFNYVAIGAAGALGLSLKLQKPLNIMGYALGASMTFFIVSNFGYFAQGYNGFSFSGLAKTYIEAIPYYKNSFIADMVGAVVLFGGYAVVRKQANAHLTNATV